MIFCFSKSYDFTFEENRLTRVFGGWWLLWILFFEKSDAQRQSLKSEEIGMVHRLLFYLLENKSKNAWWSMQCDIPQIIQQHDIILLDAICVICNGWAKFLIQNDHQKNSNLPLCNLCLGKPC